MADLIAELKGEHAAIATLLRDIKAQGIGSAQTQRKLQLARHGFLGHLRKEEERLYPVLRQAAARNEKLQHMLDVFAGEMAQLSKAAVDFFDRYAMGGDGGAFAREFSRIAGTLAARIDNEETLLYVAYQKVAVASSAEQRR